MKNRNCRHLAWALALLGVAASARAQADAEAEAQAQREIERAREEVQRATVDAERQLVQARTQLEQAARDLARLSEQQRGTYARRAPGVFVYGGRSVLGINLGAEPTELGARVLGVTPNGPAANAGVVVDDVIVAIDGTDLTGLGPPSPTQRLVEQTRDLEPGETVTLRVLRGGDYRDLTVVTRAREAWAGLAQLQQLPQQLQQLPQVAPQAFTQMRLRTPFRLFGAGAWGNLELVQLTPGLGSYFGTDEGLLVVRASENTLGFRDGDVILDIGGREPTNAEHALRIMSSFEPGEMLRVTIMRERRRETLEVRVPTAEVYAEWFRGGV